MTIFNKNFLLIAGILTVSSAPVNAYEYLEYESVGYVIQRSEYQSPTGVMKREATVSLPDVYDVVGTIYSCDNFNTIDARMVTMYSYRMVQ